MTEIKVGNRDCKRILKVHNSFYEKLGNDRKAWKGGIVRLKMWWIEKWMKGCNSKRQKKEIRK